MRLPGCAFQLIFLVWRASDAVLYLTCYVGLALSLSLLMGYAYARVAFCPVGDLPIL